MITPLEIVFGSVLDTIISSLGLDELFLLSWASLSPFWILRHQARTRARPCSNPTPIFALFDRAVLMAYHHFYGRKRVSSTPLADVGDEVWFSPNRTCYFRRPFQYLAVSWTL